MSTSTHTRQTHDSGPNTKPKAKGTKDRTCIGCSEAFEKAEQRAQEREKKKIPQPWIQRKMMIFIVLALFGWSSYTFWGVILRRCWQRAPDALVGFVAGIVLTVIYGLLWLMFFITYLKIIFTPPGFARDHVEPSDPPLPSDPPPNIDSYYPSSFASTRPSHGVVYPPSKQPPASEFRPSLDERLTHETHSLNDHGEFAITPTEPIGVPYESMPSKSGQTHKRNASNSAIPPTTPRHERNISTSTSPPSPTTPVSPSKPSLLTKKSRKDSTSSTTKPSVLANPKESFSSSRVSAETATAGDGTAKNSQRPNKLVRSGSVGSRNANISPPASPGIPSFSQSANSPTHRSAPGVRYDSRASEPTRPTPAVHPRMRSYSHTKATNMPSDLTIVHTPSSQTPGVVPSSTHPNVNLAGRTEPYDEQTIPYGNDIPKPYLDDLPPELSRWDRKPSPRPVLDPYQRYCYREGFVKPPRTHHCRICNTCVLGYDHHCPWIGGCVGAQNRKFFVVFVFWCSIYLFFCMGLLIPEIVKHATTPENPPGTPATFNTPNIDANLIALLVASGLFCLFSTGMFFTHLHLLCRNASTVEWHTFSSMREQERAVLSQVIPVCKCLGMGSEGEGGLLGRREDNQPFRGNPRKELGLPSGFKGRRALRKRWDEEWGRIGKEGNLWWLGSNRANWEAVMGANPWTWFLPVGHTKTAGVHYPVNPRFDPHGRWRRRREWPLELR